ncbi:CoA transferase [Epibacterium sp. SM1969]|uniref:CoA transferase n=1 Tax=Tritonibacter aquimaris TaxID=2663379 RepID=A0A844AN75_9RHOB|nr:CaiB/BaiF CoA-transferase family protein [Tritonibacter aquimaris]MQY43970.1 CoA transferase [Tritonibacter aquimaris]
MHGALHGIRIIEVSQVLAAPFCGYQFALLGADVIKVELPDAPDCARGRGPLEELNNQGIGLTYQVQGGNKKSLALDIRSQTGRETLLRLVETADVLIENYATGVLQGLGLGYEDMRSRNPEIIYCSMTGYGDTGPKATKGAYDNTIQAASGTIAQCNGVKPGVSFVDYAAGYSAAFAISAALLQKPRTGKGCYISASMLEVALSLMGPEAAALQAAPGASKRKEAGISAFETADGVLMLGAFKPAQYRKLGRCLEDIGYPVPILSGITAWADIWANSDAIRVALQDIFIRQSAAKWQVHLEGWDIPAERVATLSSAIAEAQVSARGYFSKSPANPEITLPLAGYKMSAGGPDLTLAPPSLGQDSREILEQAGLKASEIDALVQEGIVK